MNGIIRKAFDPAQLLSTPAPGRRVIQFPPKHAFFSQGDKADSVFYLHRGRAKVTIVSSAGKMATITLLSEGEFFGEEALNSGLPQRLTTVTALTPCTALKIRNEELLRMLHEDQNFSDHFLDYLLKRNLRTQADLVDQLFNSSEKRLARILLLMAGHEGPGDTEPTLPKISQETLAEMIGTTRSRVSFFMSRFRKQGFIEYNGRIQVRKSLRNVLLYDAPGMIPSIRLHPEAQAGIN